MNVQFVTPQARDNELSRFTGYCQAAVLVLNLIESGFDVDAAREAVRGETRKMADRLKAMEIALEVSA